MLFVVPRENAEILEGRKDRTNFVCSEVSPGSMVLFHVYLRVYLGPKQRDLLLGVVVFFAECAAASIRGE